MLELVLFIVFICIPIFSFVVFLFYKGIQLLKKNGHKKAAIAIPIIVIGAIAYTTFRAFYPSDQFYKEEFEKELGISFPKSAKIINKNASYPDQFGDYSAHFSMEMDKKDFDSLTIKFPANISKDSIGSDYPTINGHYDQHKVTFVNHREIQNHGPIEVDLVFLDDHKTVIFTRDSW